MNIYDVSEHAGVSIATVSRVLNGNPNVSEKTREKVLKVMDELGYTPNVFARGLGLNTMRTIGTVSYTHLSLADNKGKAFNLRPGTNRQRLEYYRESLRSLGLGLEDKMDVKVGVLSGGQRQAMALLMSTMTPIEFLILDEHTCLLYTSRCV